MTLEMGPESPVQRWHGSAVETVSGLRCARDLARQPKLYGSGEKRRTACSGCSRDGYYLTGQDQHR